MSEDTIPTEMEHFGVYIVGHDAYPVAMFRYHVEANDWATENYYGSWIIKKIMLPLIPFATEEEWEEAKNSTEYDWIRERTENNN